MVTGEGSIDGSSVMGKGVGRVAEECRRLGIPCIGIGGVVSRTPRILDAFDRLAAMADLAEPARTKAQPELWLKRIAEAVAAHWKPESLKSGRGRLRSGR